MRLWRRTAISRFEPSALRSEFCACIGRCLSIRRREHWGSSFFVLASVGANYRAACRARSRAEFIAKLWIVSEEADETVFWSELLLEAGIVEPEKLEPLVKEANELTSIFVSSICTAKR